MKIIYKERHFLDKFKCIDHTMTVNVLGLASTQGELLYFKKDAFNYLVISKSDLLSVEE